MHDEDSHHPSKDKSKHLKWRQIKVVHTGVLVSLNQSARQLCCNLVNLSPKKRVDPKHLRNLKHLVCKAKATVTQEQLNQTSINDSFDSLAEAKWFPTLLAKHVGRDTDFYIGIMTECSMYLLLVSKSFC